jgi:hypothetical protein
MTLGNAAMSDEALRVFIYDQTIGHGPIPTSDTIASHFDSDAAEVRRRLALLRIGKTVAVHPSTGEVWMAGPFSAEPSSYRLTDGATTWYANCAWDMFGVAMLVDRPLVAHTACTDCGEPMTLACDPSRPPAGDAGVVHFLVPARRWYDDLGFT